MRAKTSALILFVFVSFLVNAGCGGGDAATDGATSGTATGGAATGESGTTGGAATTSGATTTAGGSTDAATSGTSGTSEASEATSGTTDATTSGTGEGSSGAASTSGETGGATTGEAMALPWTYIAAVDKGIRDDEYGLGAFQAPRKGYKHSGIDYSMPVGTALTAPCDGAYLAGYDGGYGIWVQVICPVPSSVAGDATVFASLLFAHLDTLAVAETGVDPNDAGAVTRGQTIGTAGKTGNASAQGIHAHLHFEVALHDSELAALQEAHISGADADTPAAAALRAALTAACLDPHGFAPLYTTLSLGRRIDPFIFLTCLVGDKPPLTPPADQPLHAWSDDYTAESFDVDVGLQ